MPTLRAGTKASGFKAVKDALDGKQAALATAVVFEKPAEPIATTLPPTRTHSSQYHYPLLVDDKSQCDALLAWFESVEDSRTMPWRKAWIDPSQAVGTSDKIEDVLNKRAYEIWVSEVSK